MTSLDDYELGIREQVNAGNLALDTGIKMIEDAVEAEIVFFQTMKMMEALTLTQTKET